MGAVPKRKISKSRQGERRSHLHLGPLALVDCPQCHRPRLPHRACRACGYYKGMEILKTKTAKKEKK
ncbi:MAG: 50S ribosomal protein L32 [Chloroflexi bacterium]|nr:50S ribosomal protein L32 [Chloroflexota bacterium]